MSNSVSNELIVMKNLFNEGKFEEILQLTKDIEQNQTFTQEELLRTKGYKGLSYLFLGQFETALKIAEEIYQKSEELKLIAVSLDALFLKELVYWSTEKKEEFYQSLKLHKNLFKSVPRRDSLAHQEREAELFLIKSIENLVNGKFNPVLDYSFKSLALYEIVDPRAYFISTNLMLIGIAYRAKGELELASECWEKYFSMIPEGENWGLMFRRGVFNNSMGNISFEKGEIDRALSYYKSNLEIVIKINFIYGICVAYANIIEVLLFKNDLTQAQSYLQLFDNLNQKLSPMGKEMYQVTNAIFLKSSSRMRDRVEAEIILKRLIKESKSYETINMALIYLCDWYFEEFEISKQLEILDDIQPLIDRLLRNAKQQNSYSLLANGKLLQAKLALLQINIAEARKLLSEAQNIADDHDLQFLANEISREHDHLLDELQLWESFKKTQAPVSERLKLVSVDNVIDRMQGRLAIEHLDSIEEQPVILLILVDGNILLLSYPFSEKWKQNGNLLGSFLSAISTFRDKFVSQGLERAKFGEETLLLQSIDSFLICYLFRGQTYSAKQKLNFFSEALNKDNHTIEALKRAVSNREEINASENPHIEELIVKSFMTDTELFKTPFKAYTGEEPFVFVSYAHTDKLEVYPIIDFLNEMNVKIWYDEGILISENWKKSIAVNLERCGAFLVFITPQIINSEYVRKEISFALKKRKPFFAVYLKETKLPAELEFEIADIQAMMMYLMPKSEFQTKLKELLSNSLNS